MANLSINEWCAADDRPRSKLIIASGGWVSDTALAPGDMLTSERINAVRMRRYEKFACQVSRFQHQREHRSPQARVGVCQVFSDLLGKMPDGVDVMFTSLAAMRAAPPDGCRAGRHGCRLRGRLLKRHECWDGRVP